jgi:hypothetical protein
LCGLLWHRAFPRLPRSIETEMCTCNARVCVCVCVKGMDERGNA